MEIRRLFTLFFSAGMLLLPNAFPFTVSQTAAGKRLIVDEVKIAVNDKVLTRRDVAGLKALRIQQYQAQFKGDDLRQKLEKIDEELEKEIIEDLLVESHAELLKIEISDRTIEARVDNILRRQPEMGEIYSEEQLKLFVLKNLLRRRVIGREVDSRIRVTDADIMEACQVRARDNREVDVGHILFRGSNSDALLERAKALHQALEQGADFEEMALKHSQDPSAAENKGRLGFIGKGQFVKPFQEMAFSLPVGGLSDPVKTRFGYHLIKVFGERIKGKIDCDNLDAVARQSLHNQVFARFRNVRLEAFFVRIRKKAEIRVVRR